MISAYLGVLDREFSGERAQRHVVEIGRHYRSPGSDGYQATIEYVKEVLGSLSVDYRVREFPLDGKTTILEESVPLAWEPVGGSLEFVSPDSGTLVRWDECPSCIPWWCPPTPRGGVELEVVDVGTGATDEDYKGRDVRGKAVLVTDIGENFAWRDIVVRAQHHGAAGIITNYLLYQYPPWRTREALPEAVQQLRLPVKLDNPWVFTVSETAFEQVLAALSNASTPVVVRFSVEARTFEGTSRSVLATIPASSATDDCILLVSHATAATKPGANCASGIALMLELAGTLKRLLAGGELPPLKRNIHFLFANEGCGSLDLAEAEPAIRESAIAALALCSVGHDQAKTKSSLIVSRSPDALPTFLNDLLEGLLDEHTDELAWAYRAGSGEIPYVRCKILPYTPWSDNATWSRIGVPGILFMSLPDLYFHTQLLTANETDPKVFARSAALVGTAALVTACAGLLEVGDLMRRVAAASQARLNAVCLEGMDTGSQDESRFAKATDALSYLVERDIANLRSALRLVSAEDSDEAAREAGQLEGQLREMARVLTAVLNERIHPGTEEGRSPRSSGVRIRRTSENGPKGAPGFGYVELRDLANLMAAGDRGIAVETLKLFIDGIWFASCSSTTIGDVTGALAHEFGFKISPDHVLRLAEGLQRAGFIALT